MRRALLVLFLSCAGLAGGCSKPALEPALLGETRGLDAEVLALIETKVAAVRAAPSDAHAHADLGLVYEANGLWDAAEQSYAHALALDGSQTIWLYHRALCLREGGQSEAALAELHAAAKELPKHPAVQQRLGQWLLDGGDSEGARAAFQRALAGRPDQPEFLTGLASVELSYERWNEALLLARRALKGNAGYGPAHYAAGRALQALGRTEEAKGELGAGMNAKVSWCPDELSTAHTSYRLTTTSLADDAAREANSGNYSRAVELFEKLALRKPEDTDILNNLGANLIETGRLERAGEVLKKTLALAPDSFPAHLNMSELYMRTKKLDLARAEAERAVELGGTVGRTHYHLARVLAMQQDLAGAYEELKRAVALDARDERMFLALTDTCARLGKSEEARSWCRRALDLNSNSVPGRGILGMLALTAGDFEEARSSLALLEKIAPQDPRTAALRDGLAKSGR